LRRHHLHRAAQAADLLAQAEEPEAPTPGRRRRLGRVEADALVLDIELQSSARAPDGDVRGRGAGVFNDVRQELPYGAKYEARGGLAEGFLRLVIAHLDVYPPALSEIFGEPREGVL